MNAQTKPPSWPVYVVVIALAFATGAIVSWWQMQRGSSEMADGLLWPDPPRVAPVHLVDQRGEPFTLDDLRGRWTLLFFGFTSCPDVCPTTLDALARAHETLGANARYAERGQVVFVSVDPERDTPAQIAEYVAHFHRDFLGVTASEEALTEFARNLGALFMKVPQGEGNYTMDHSAGVFLIDPELRLVSVITPPHSPAGIVARFEGVSAWLANNT